MSSLNLLFGILEVINHQWNYLRFLEDAIITVHSLLDEYDDQVKSFNYCYFMSVEFTIGNFIPFLNRYFVSSLFLGRFLVLFSFFLGCNYLYGYMVL